MTCGIYKLNFNNTDKVYIGQSLDISSRWYKHTSSFTRCAAPEKLQLAYDTYGMPSIEILLECTPTELNAVEKEAIEIFDSVENGYNTLEESGNPIMYGEASGMYRYANHQYIDVLYLLVQKTPTLSKREIEALTGVSIYTIRHIAALESHCWLETECPKEYAELKRIKEEEPYNYGLQYPPIISPDGIVYQVKHATNFAKENGLLQPKLTALLRGTRNMHKGWVRYEG